MTKVILLNGPPRSGKDTAGEILARRIRRAKVVKFAGCLKLATQAMVHTFIGVDMPNRVDMYEVVKDNHAFRGKTWRQLYIGVSELLCKPLFGGAFFGEMLVSEMQRLAALHDVFVVTDGGFVQELDPVIEFVGRGNLHVVKISRPGTSYARDSRGYLPDCADSFASNTSTLEVLEAQLDAAIRWAQA